MKVTVYTSPTCQPCKATKRKLTKEGVPFAEVDLTTDEAALAELKRSLGVEILPMPVVKVEGGAAPELWTDYRPDKLAALAIAYGAAA